MASSSLVEVVDRILDKGIVIDAWARASLVGIELLTIEASGVEGIIIGRALYEKTIDLKEALALANTNSQH